MVVTRKRSCSASEPATGTPARPLKAKLRKQAGSIASPSTRTTTRCVDTCGTSATATATTPTTTRTRRVTDSADDVAQPSPRPSRITRSSNNQDSRTPLRTTRMKNSSGETDGKTSDVKEVRVNLKDIAMPSTPSRRTRRQSRGETCGVDAAAVSTDAETMSSDSVDVTASSTTSTVSTPIRRSRRLSGSGVEDTVSQGTPKQLSFSIAQIIGGEGRKAKEDMDSKQSNLPVINEDVEHTENKNTSLGSPKKTSKSHPAGEKSAVEQKSDPAVQSLCDDKMEETNSTGKTISDTVLSTSDLPVPAGDMEASSTVPVNQEVEREASSILPVIKELGRKDKQEEQSVNSVKCDEEQKTNSNDSNVKSDSKVMKIYSKEEKEQNNAMNTLDSIEVTTNPVKPFIPKEECETAPNGEIANDSPITQGTQVTSSAPIDENCNKNLNGMKPLLPQVTAGDKKLLKAFPELEKKIEQIRSVPKGQSISGKWWKKEKQRFRSINKDASGKKRWSKKMQLKQWREDVKAKSAAIEAEKQKKKDDLKERQKINKIRREENAKKAEIVQVIKDPRKIKKMKRKQLRQIETRDIDNLKQV